MRLRRNRLIECNHRRAIPVKDKEGVTTIEYGTPSSFLRKCGQVAESCRRNVTESVCRTSEIYALMETIGRLWRTEKYGTSLMTASPCP